MPTQHGTSSATSWNPWLSVATVATARISVATVAGTINLGAETAWWKHAVVRDASNEFCEELRKWHQTLCERVMDGDALSPEQRVELEHELELYRFYQNRHIEYMHTGCPMGG